MSDMLKDFSFNTWLHTGGPSRLYPYFTFWMTMIIMGMDYTITGSIQAADSWQEYFGYPTGSRLGLLTGITTLGMALGAPVASMVSDRYGRKTSAYIGATIGFIAGCLQAGAVSVDMYLVARFFVGFGLCQAHAASPPFLSEMAPSSERTLAMGIYFPLYTLGSIVMSWVCYATTDLPTSWGWRGPCILQAIPPLIQLAMLPFCPESPRWLAVKGRHEEAHAILVKWHGHGVETEEVQETFKSLVLASEEVEDKGHWREMVATKSNRIRFTIIFFSAIFCQLSGNSLISYYFTTIMDNVGYTSAKTQTLFNAMLSVWGLIWNLSTAGLTQRFGRRVIFLTGAVGMLITFSIFTAATAEYDKTLNSSYGKLVLACIYFFNTFYGLAWSAIAFYPIENMPTRLRGKSQACVVFFDNTALFITLYVNPIAMDAIAWKFFFVYIGILCFECAFGYLFYVETNKAHLEDIQAYWNGVLEEPRYFGGPGSAKRMREVARVCAEKRDDAVVMSDGGSGSDEKVGEGKEGGVVVSVLGA